MDSNAFLEVEGVGAEVEEVDAVEDVAAEVDVGMHSVSCGA